MAPITLPDSNFAPLASLNNGIVSDVGGSNSPLVTVSNLPPYNTPTKDNVSITQSAPLQVESSGVPIFAESSNSGDVNLPQGFQLAPSSVVSSAVYDEQSGKTIDPNTGAYYDEKLNAWLMPTSEAYEQSTFTPSNSTAPDNAIVVAPSATKVLGGDNEGQSNVFVPGTPVTEFPLSSLDGNALAPSSNAPLSNLNIVPSIEQTNTAIEPTQATNPLSSLNQTSSNPSATVAPLSQPPAQVADNTQTDNAGITAITPETPMIQGPDGGWIPDPNPTGPVNYSNPSTPTTGGGLSSVTGTSMDGGSTAPQTSDEGNTSQSGFTPMPIVNYSPTGGGSSQSGQPTVDLTPINKQLSDLQTGQSSLNDQYNALSQSQKDIVDALTKQGTNAQTAIDTVTKSVTDLSKTVANNQDITTQAITDLGTNVNNQVGALNTGLQNTNTLLGNATAQEQADFAKLNSQQQQQALDMANQGTTLGNAIDAVNTNLSDAQQKEVANQVAMGKSLNDAILSVQTGLSTSLDTTNKTIAENQAQTEEKLNNLSDAQKAQVASQVAMGVSLTAAINSVQSNVNSQISGLGTNVSNLTGNVNNLQTTLNDMSKTTPKATLLKGNQIASPLASSYVIPTNTYATPAPDPNQLAEIQNAAEGGIMHMASGGDLPMAPKLLRGQSTQHPNLMGWHGAQLFADGGVAKEHNPEFFSEGGLNSIKHRYVTGAGDGTSDSIPAMLANGEFVIPADVVSSLGNGSNDSGAKVLDEFMKTIRAHKQKHDAKDLPPDSKGALSYLLAAKKKVRA